MTDDAPQLRGELRKLSSLRTEMARVGGILVASLATAAALGSFATRNAGVIFVFVGVSALLWVLLAVVGPKVVETDGYWLLVSDLRKTVWIPLRQIDSVNRGRLPGSRWVYVEFGCDTPFGREISFDSQLDLGALFGQRPVVEDLRELVASAKAAHVRPGSCGS